MRILLTGASGFLGKYVLDELLKSDDIEIIITISRYKGSHPNSKVRPLKGDLCDPSLWSAIKSDFNCIVHLAGNYNLGSSRIQDYRANVIAAGNLFSYLKQIPELKYGIHYASTYALGMGNWDKFDIEKELKEIPNNRHSYIKSKALAELCLTSMGLPINVYRLGIIVGDSISGYLERLDGPYYYLNFFSHLKRLGLLGKFGYLPVPMSRDAFLPLIPVDIAGKAIASGILKHPPKKVEYIGVFNSASTSVERLLNKMLEALNSRVKPIYMPKANNFCSYHSSSVGIPNLALSLCQGVPVLLNSNFPNQITGIKIPDFNDYAKSFFFGYEQLNRATRNG